jgi:hypothetical protein
MVYSESYIGTTITTFLPPCPTSSTSTNVHNISLHPNTVEVDEQMPE